MSKVFYDKPIIDQIFEEFSYFLGDHDINKLIKLVEKLPPEDVNKQDNVFCTVLMHASWLGHTKIVKLLLEKEGIDVNMQDNIGRTALKYASDYGHNEIVELLKNHKQIS